jgi:hypothetical protein
MRSRIIVCIAAVLVLLSLIVLVLTGKRDGPAGSSAVATLEQALKEKAAREERERVQAELDKKIFELEQHRHELDQQIEEAWRRYEQSKAEFKERTGMTREEHLRPYDEIFDVAGPARRRAEAGDSHPAGLVRPPTHR